MVQFPGERSPKQKLSNKSCCFKLMCQTLLTNSKLLPDLIRAVIDGGINVVYMKPLHLSEGEFRLSSLCFNPDDIKQFRTKFKKGRPNNYSIPEVAIKMGVKQQVAYHLVNAGFLKCHQDSTRLRRGRLITLKEIWDFERIYVPLTKIALQRNRCSRSILLMLIRLGISPAIGGGADSCRQVFYRISDLPESFGLRSTKQ